MRLTLRTLLAYRDGVLDPKDAAVLEAKIMDSSTAKQISQRITDEMKNRKLAPIPVDAREFGFEANMVAEFLDDTISMETLPEMERKCLENNTLLSEIGSCHQILSRALSIPAPISSSLRQRIHDLPNNPSLKGYSNTGGRIRRFDSGTVSVQSDSRPDTEKSISTSIDIPTNKPVRKSNIELRGSGIELNDGLGRQVPEYLIGNDRGWLKSAAFGLLLFASLVVVGAIAIGPIERVQALLRKTEIASDEPNDKAAETASEEKEQPRKLTPPVEKSTVPSNFLEMESTFTESSAGPPVPLSSTNSVPKQLEPISPDSQSVDGSKSATVAADSISKPASPPTGNRIQWLPDTKESSDMIVLKSDNSKEAGSTFWRRMHAGEFVAAGERLVVPPTQRTEMRVEPGIRLLCAGENDLEHSLSGAGPSVGIRSGRFFVFATPDAKEINFNCNGLVLSIRFASADSGCALEMQNEWFTQATEIVRSQKFPISSRIRLIGVKGETEYFSKATTGEETKGTLSVGQYIHWKNGESTGALELAEEPWWFRTSVARPIDQLAAKELQRAIIGREPGAIDAELLEQTSSLRKHGETVAIAARTRMMLGHYDGLFEPDGVFNRGKLHIHWASLFSQILQSLSRDENRVALENAIQSLGPPRANTLSLLLIPPTQEQLVAGSDKILVESLVSPSMDERVLAFQQLNLITGKTLEYHPDKNPSEGALQWRKLLGKSEIRYMNLPNHSTNLEPSQ